MSIKNLNEKMKQTDSSSVSESKYNKVDINYLIEKEVERISNKYGKDFLNCGDLVKITGLGRDSVRNLLRNHKFPTTHVGTRQVVSVVNFVTWMILKNNEVKNG